MMSFGYIAVFMTLFYVINVVFFFREKGRVVDHVLDTKKVNLPQNSDFLEESSFKVQSIKIVETK